MTISRTVGGPAKAATRLYLVLQLLKKISKDEAQTLQDQGAIVFLLYRNKIANDILKDLEEFIYVPLSAGEKQADLIKWVSRYIPRASFQAIGLTPARQVDDLLQNCQKLTDESLTDGTVYAVTQGALKGFWVRLTPTASEGDDLFVSPIFGPNKNIEYQVPKGALTKMTDLVLPKEVQRVSIREMHNRTTKRAFVVDGHNLLYRSAFANWNIFSNDRRTFIGAATGFYYTLLRLCRAYPEYEMHFVFDPDPTIRKAFGWKDSKPGVSDPDVKASTVAARMQNMPEYKANRDRLKDSFYEHLSVNLIWLLHFLKACGFNVYSHPHHEGDNILGSLVGDIRRKHPDNYEIIIFSTDTDMLQLVDEKTCIYKPKARAFDFNCLVKMPEVMEQFPVGETRKINWVRAVMGDTSDNIMSVYKWWKETQGVKKIFFAKDIYAHAVASETEEAYLEALKGMGVEMQQFIDAKYYDNISLLQILDTIDGIELKTPQPPDPEKMQELLKSLNLFKELELFHEKVLPALASYT